MKKENPFQKLSRIISEYYEEIEEDMGYRAYTIFPILVTLVIILLMILFIH